MTKREVLEQLIEEAKIRFMEAPIDEMKKLKYVIQYLDSELEFEIQNEEEIARN